MPAKFSDQSSRKRGWTGALIVLGLALWGGAIAAYGTAEAPWSYSDGVGYMTVARNVANGTGLGLVKASGEFEALVSHPPGYPWLLAGLLKLGSPILTAVRILDVLALAAFLGLVAWAVLRSTGSRMTAIVTGILLSAVPGLVYMFLSAMAEPIFLVAGFLALYLVSVDRNEPSCGVWVGSALAAGLSILVRYPGIAFAVTSVLWIEWRSAAPWRRRLSLALGYLTISLAPVAAFLAWRTVVLHGAGPKALAESSQATIAEYLRKAGQVIWSWKPIPPSSVTELLLPTAWGAPARYSIVGLLALGGVAVAPWVWISLVGHWKRDRSGVQVNTIALACLLFIPVYLLLYAGAYLISYPTPDIDGRTLLPILPAILMALMLFGWNIVSNRATPWAIRAGVIAGIIGVTLGYGVMGYDIVVGLHRTGGGYTGIAWRESETLAVALNLAEDRPLASNAPEAILLYSGNYPYSLHDLPNTDDCPPEIARILAQGGVLVSFDPTKLPGARTWNEDELTTSCRIRGSTQLADGEILTTAPN